MKVYIGTSEKKTIRAYPQFSYEDRIYVRDFNTYYVNGGGTARSYEVTENTIKGLKEV